MNEISKKVSIVMSVYGYHEYIDSSIKSILDQTLDDFEFIIVDDGCNYDLSGIINQFDDERIIYIWNPWNIGLTASLVKAIEKSKGKYIARHDAGNISLKDRIEKQYRFLEENSCFYLAGSSVELIDESGSKICSIIANDDPYYIREKLPLYNCINHSTIMFRNTGDAGYRSKFKYSQDYDFYLNLLSKNLVPVNIRDVLVKERMIKTSITYSKNDEQEFYKKLAQRFYNERIKSDRDSYSLFDENDLPGSIKEVVKAESRDAETYFYGMQEAYYLLFSGRTGRARGKITGLLKEKFNLKLFMYLITSFFPFAIKLRNKMKGLEFE
jgi:glycosyltransferase involved in cell wall biosynthesis